MHRLLDAYQQRQAELELQERVMMTAKMRDTGRRLLADVDEYTECRRRVFAGIQEGVVTEGAGAAVLEAVRQAEALIRSYTSLSQICRSLMEKETVFTDKYARLRSLILPGYLLGGCANDGWYGGRRVVPGTCRG